MKKVNGFTLIELLVVIAIIGILATVVIGAVNSARVKGADAGIRANITNTRVSGAIHNDTAGSYTTVCASNNPVYGAVLVAAKLYGGSTSSISSNTNGAVAVADNFTGSVNGACQSNAQGYAALAVLKSNRYRAWCADSSGFSRMINIDPSPTPFTFTIPAAGANGTPVCPDQ